MHCHSLSSYYFAISIIMFDAPEDVLMAPVMDPPDGTVAHISTKSLEQIWFYICVPILLVVPAIFVAI